MKAQIKQCIYLLFLFGLVSCTQTPDMVVQSTSTSVPTNTATQQITSTYLESFPTTATPVPAQPTYVKITPDAAQIANWKAYETALANRTMFYEISKGNEIICEWELLGQNENELYVWTICSTAAPLISDAGEDFYPTSSIPALIQLDDNGNVVEVKTPGAGSLYASDIGKLFPKDIQEIIFYQKIDTITLDEHLSTRRAFPDYPPLIISSNSQ